MSQTVKVADLHVHAGCSLLGGAIRIGGLLSRGKDLGMPAVAITNHGSVYGAVAFYMTALNMGVKPIIGCDVYAAEGNVDDEMEPSHASMPIEGGPDPKKAGVCRRPPCHAFRLRTEKNVTSGLP